MSDRVECAVIGAGVVGLAIARELARSGLETVVLERESRVGTVTSSRNSEVIHAGIYYPNGSLKSALCVRGKDLLYEYCNERGIAHRRCGKLIVATADEQRGKLGEIVKAAAANGVTDLQMLDRGQARALESELECVAAVLSPSTGIVDSHSLMLSFRGDFESSGGMIGFGSPVVGGHCSTGGIVLEVGGELDTELTAMYVVNSAGLAAQDVANAINGIPPETIPGIHYAKGTYYSLNRRSPFGRLVYPVPEPGGLGIHLTLDLSGRARFGPDVDWVDQINYAVDEGRSVRFYDEIRRYWPGLRDQALAPSYAGIRPKLSGPGDAAADFVIQDEQAHGIRGLVNLYGIESPGLTASIAIAEEVRTSLLGKEA